ncbi:alanine dehydrogenase [Anoxynatronum sibiricum]|uniref:Alanine dehydrogenase n=1 Tax=Anoxynatronum sibiricum TaxID=210623 RepID=A0ABU9VTC2_9CLOT
MRLVKSIGFPKMHKEESEKRDFLPRFFEDLQGYEVDICLEKGYGERLGFTETDYLQSNPHICFADLAEVYQSDAIIVLRCPETDEINLIREGAVLISMLHYETRETRNELLRERKINCFSMDAMVNDENERILVNYRGTSTAGSRIAFEELKKRTNDFRQIQENLIHISIIGAGAVAANAAKAFEAFGDNEFLTTDKGLIIHMLPRAVTQKESLLQQILAHTHVLVDASKRPDPSRFIISNQLLACLPACAVILDLAADPYNEQTTPIQVKGIEGIPTGTLDKYIIEPDDDMYEHLPPSVSTTNRRVVISCNAWPGVDAKECMEIYGKQMIPHIDVLLSKPIEALDLNSRNLYERSLVKSSLSYYSSTK